MQPHFHSQGKCSFKLIPQLDNPHIPDSFISIYVIKLMNGREQCSSILDKKDSTLCHPHLQLNLPQWLPHEIPQSKPRLSIQYNHHSFTPRSAYIDQKCLLLLSSSWNHYHDWGVSNLPCTNFFFSEHKSSILTTKDQHYSLMLLIL